MAIEFNARHGLTVGQNSFIVSDSDGNLAGISANISGNAIISGHTIFGDPGTESSGINVGGVTYQSTHKTSDIGGSNAAQTIIHRHSTTLGPLHLYARSNSDTSSHAAVTAGQDIGSVYAAGYAGTNYKLFGSWVFAADTGTISQTSSPGKWTLSITPNASVIPVAAITVGNTGNTAIAANLTVTGAIAGTLSTAAQTNVTSVGNLTSLNVTGNVGLGAAANVPARQLEVEDGSNPQVRLSYAPGSVYTDLETDSSGNLVITPTGGYVIANVVGSVIGNVAAAGANTQVQFNNANLLGASSNFTWNGTNLAITGGQTVTGNLTAGNLYGTTGVFTSVSGTLTTAAQTNITSVGTLSALTVSGNVGAGNLNATTGVTGVTGTFTGNVGTGNVSGTTGTFTNVGGTLTTAAQTNITSLGTLSALTVTGNVGTGNVSGTTGTFTNIGGTLTTAAQTNITSLGTLTSLSVTGNVSAGNLSGTSIVGTLTTAAQTNITSLGTLTSLTVTGNVGTGNVSGTTGTFTNVGGTLTTASQTNITAVGTLTTGTWNATTIAAIRGGTGLASFAAGTILRASGANVWAASTATFPDTAVSGRIMRASGANVWTQSTSTYPDTVATGQIIRASGTNAFSITTATYPSTVATGQILRASATNVISASTATYPNTIGSGQILRASAANVISATTATYPTTITSGQILYATAANVISSGTGLTFNGTNLAVTGGQTVTGNLTAGNLYGTVRTVAQPSITSLGTLTSLVVTGNVSTGNVSGTTGTFTNVGGTLTTAAQTNITSVGTLTSLAVTGNISGGNLSTPNTITQSGTVGYDTRKTYYKTITATTTTTPVQFTFAASTDFVLGGYIKLTMYNTANGVSSIQTARAAFNMYQTNANAVVVTVGSTEILGPGDILGNITGSTGTNSANINLNSITASGNNVIDMSLEVVSSNNNIPTIVF